jgi:hypothetical protein
VHEEDDCINRYGVLDKIRNPDIVLLACVPEFVQVVALARLPRTQR